MTDRFRVPTLLAVIAALAAIFIYFFVPPEGRDLLFLVFIGLPTLIAVFFASIFLPGFAIYGILEDSPLLTGSPYRSRLLILSGVAIWLTVIFALGSDSPLPALRHTHPWWFTAIMAIPFSAAAYILAAALYLFFRWEPPSRHVPKSDQAVNKPGLPLWKEAILVLAAISTILAFIVQALGIKQLAGIPLPWSVD